MRLTFGSGPGSPQRLGKDRRERGSWIVVGADDRRDIAARDLGADACDLANWVAAPAETLSPAVDQLLEARAGIIMEQVGEAGMGKPAQLAVVAEGRANHENVAGRAETAERLRNRPGTLLRDTLHRCAFEAGVVSLAFLKAFHLALQFVEKQEKGPETRPFH